MTSKNMRIVSCWSKAGIGTSIVLEYQNTNSKKNPRIVLDLGATPIYEDAIRASTVLISHGHVDHIGAVFSHARAHAVACGGSVPTYYVPEAIRPMLESARDAMAALDSAGGGERKALLDMNIVGVEPGDQVELFLKGGVKLFCRVFGVQHASCPAVGYVIGSQCPPTLKEEYRGLDKQEIRELLANGVSIKTEATEVLEVAYTGDTSVEGLIINSEEFPDERAAKSALYMQQAFQCGLLLCEATFLDDSEKSKDLCQARGHLHLQDIERAITLHKFVETNQRLVLLHISARYGATEAMNEIANVVPKAMANRCLVGITSLLKNSDDERSWRFLVKGNGCILLSDYIKRRDKATADKGRPKFHQKRFHRPRWKPKGASKDAKVDAKGAHKDKATDAKGAHKDKEADVKSD